MSSLEIESLEAKIANIQSRLPGRKARASMGAGKRTAPAAVASTADAAGEGFLDEASAAEASAAGDAPPTETETEDTSGDTGGEYVAPMSVSPISVGGGGTLQGGASSSSDAEAPAETDTTDTEGGGAGERERGPSPMDLATVEELTGADRSTVRGAKMWEQGREQLRKQEQKRHEAPDGCTFQPAVIHAKKASKAGAKEVAGQERFNLLYQNGAAILSKKEQMRNDAAKEEGCSFQPKITSKARRNSVTGKRGPKSGEKEARFNKLYQDGARHAEKVAQQRRASEFNGCTFKPEITKKAEKKKFEGCVGAGGVCVCVCVYVCVWLCGCGVCEVKDAVFVFDTCERSCF